MSMKAPSQKDATHLAGQNIASESDPYFRLKTSQKETFSEASTLGLKDVFYKNDPDLSHYCDECKTFISLTSLGDHRLYHTAMRSLQLDDVHKSHTSSDFLLKKRNKLLKNLKDDCMKCNKSFDIEKAKKIDEAYEFLKQDVEDTFESCRKINENLDPNIEGFDVDCSLDMVQAVGYCSTDNTRWKVSMEDTKVYQDHFGNDSAKAFLALYDGYNGKYAAEVAANELHYVLLNELCSGDPTMNCTCTFNMLEENDISGYGFIRPTTTTAGYQAKFHRNSRNILHQIIYTCEAPSNQLQHLSTHHPIICKPKSGNSDDPVKSSKKSEDSDRRIKEAFRVAYKLTDIILSHGGAEKSRVRWSGCSALTILAEDVVDQSTQNTLLQEQTNSEAVEMNEDNANQKKKRDFSPPRTIGKLHLAHAGNCQAVLVRNNKSYPLLKMHTYENEKERKRVERQGGSFSNSERARYVNGVSATTRGLGNYGDPSLRKIISPDPQCTTVKVDQYCQFLIMATPGIWQALSHHEAADLLLQLLPQNRVPTPGYISPSIEQLLKPPAVENKASDDADSRATIHAENDETHEATKELLQVTGSPESTDYPLHSQTDKADPPDVEVKINKPEALSSKKPPQPASNIATNHTPDAPTATVADSLDGTYESSVLFKPEAVVKARSDDSGNEADVDTDWASTVVPEEFRDRAVSSNVSIHRQMSRMLAERLVQAAILAGAKENLTVIVMLLPGTRL